MQRAAGILFRTADGRVLLLHRTDGQGWALPGGGIEDGETPEQAARRETHEETSTRYRGALLPWTRRIRDGVDFTTFLSEPVEPFAPDLNEEHDAAEWVALHQALAREDLHPGVRIALQRFDLDELGVARAMRDGELASPERFDKFLLVALRITGTGAAYRPQLKEYVWREPIYYLNDDFLERCQGLPVILEHPADGQVLGSKEFHKRIVGTVMLPYIRENEVWGIARVYDAHAIELLETRCVSTSPMVESDGVELAMDDGAHLLIEGKPELLDSVAIVPLGVWDKGGPPAGVANDHSPDGPDAGRSTSSPGDTDMAEKADEKDRKADAASVEGSKDGEKLDRVLAHLDALHKRHDAMEASHAELHKKLDEHAKRLDALEDGEGEEEEEHDLEEEGEPEPAAADAAEEGEDEAEEGEHASLEQERSGNGLKAKDSAEGRADSKKRADLEGFTEGGVFHPIRGSKGYKRKKAGDSARADSALRAENAALRSRLDAIERQIKDVPEDERTRLVETQARAERVYQAHGDSAPRWLNGETVAQYGRRLAQKMKAHSPAWKEIDLSKLPDDAFAIAERAIYADAYQAAMRPAAGGSPGLREIIETDRTGRRISRFIGDQETTWAPFKMPSRHLTGLNLRPRLNG